MKIVFRVDASYKIGTGHVIRCLTLADALKQEGVEIEFICRQLEGNLAELIGKEYKVHILPPGMYVSEEYCAHASWLEASWEEDANQSLQYAEGADWLVIDHYALDEKWEKKLRGHVGKIMVIDDLADRKHDCDMLLDQNYYRNFRSRYDGLVSKETMQLLSPKYALLRPEFEAARKSAGEKQKDEILVFFSGVDATNETGKALRAIKDYKGRVTVVAGGSNRNYESLRNYCEGKENITLHKSVTNMAELMARAGLGIGAGGSATWERCCVGLPTLVWPIADNQRQIIFDVADYGAVKLSSPETLMADLAIIDVGAISEKALKLCDGRGVRKVANHMAYNLRPAAAADCEKIFEIRNKQEVRQFSNNQDEIDFTTHAKWYGATLANPKRSLHVLEKEGQVCGVLRFDVEESSAEISIYLDPEYFGKGLGETMLEKGVKWLKNSQPKVKRLKAQVLPANLPSRSLFAKFGFEERDTYWIKEI